MDCPSAKGFISTAQLCFQYRQRLGRASLTDQFEEPALQAVVVMLVLERADQLVDVFGGDRQQQVEAFFLGLRVVSAHQVHGLFEALPGHSPRLVIAGRSGGGVFGSLGRVGAPVPFGEGRPGHGAFCGCCT